MLLFAPIVLGGNRPLPLMALELLALALTLSMALAPVPRVPRLLGWWIALTLLYPVLYLIPLPAGLWAALPGRGLYAEVLGLLGQAKNWRAGSVIRVVTEQAWLALLPPLAMLYAVVTLPARRVSLLIRLLLAMAVIQAVLAMLQFGSHVWSELYFFSRPASPGIGVGTYANRNHLAGFLEMALPVSIGLFLAAYRDSELHHGVRRSLRRRLAAMASWRPAMVVWAIVSVLMIIGIVLSRSRMGVLMAMLGIVLCVAMMARGAVSGRGKSAAVAVLGVIAVGLAAEAALAPVLQRFAGNGALGDARWPVFGRTLDAIGTFLPFGSGPGTYPLVFPRFQPEQVTYFVNHAHNDYLEWLMEGGLLAAGLLGMALVAYLGRWRALWGETWQGRRLVQVGAGIALLLMGIHSVVDFNLHIPANAIYFAFLAGVFFHPHLGKQTTTRRTAGTFRRGRHIEDITSQEPTEPPEPITNPFLD